MRVTLAKAMVVFAASAVVSATTAPSAWAQTAALCTFTIDVAVRPGVTFLPGEGTASTDRPGALDCTGVVGGRLVRPGGRISLQSSYQGSCLLNFFAGTVHLAIPTVDGGVISDSGSFTGATVQAVGHFSFFTSKVGSAEGPFEGFPTQGNCTPQDPVTGVRLVSQSFFLK